MVTMTVSLPKQMKEWIEAQVSEGAFSSTSDYVRDLVRQDRERREGARDKVYTVDELRILLADARTGGASGLSIADIRKAGRQIAMANGWLDERR